MMKRYGLVISLLIGAFFSFIGVMILYLGPGSEGGGPRFWFSHEWGPLALSFLFFITMIAGIVIGQLFQFVASKPDENIHFTELVQALNKGRSWSAILASPLVFFSTFSSLLAMGATPVAFFYAFQNGFFCLAIFSSMSAKFSRSDRKPTEIS